MSETVVVTGASGHIGFHVAQALVARGYRVALLLRSRNVLTDRLERAGAVVHLVDLLDRGSYAALLQGAAGLFHLAAANTTSQREAEATTKSTAGLAEAVIGAAIGAGVPKIVYTSSVVVLGRSPDPQRLIREDDATVSAESPYVRGKSAAERYCREQNDKGADIRIVYPSWVVGPDDPKLTPPHKVVADFVTKGQAFYFAGGISIAHVSDVAEAHVAAFERGTPRGRYVLGGENITFEDFYRLLARFSGRKAPKVFLPKGLMLALAAGAERAFGLIGAEPPIDANYVDAIIGNYSWYDSGKAVTELGYRIRPAEESLREAVLHGRRRLAGTYQLNLKSAGAAYLTQHSDDRLLITGVPGWLGSRMLDIMINGDRFGNRPPPRRIRILAHPSAKDLLELPPQIEIAYGDINDGAALMSALEGVTAVYHLAGAIWPPKVETLYRVNAEGTKNLVEACIASGVRRILFMSTDSTCGHGTAAHRVFDENTEATPYRDYGRSKLQAEQHLLRAAAEGHLDVTILRGFWFFGPYAPSRQLGFLRMFSWPRQIVFGNGRNLRSISHVDNVVDAFFKAEKNPATHGKWFWVGDAEGGRTVDAIYETVAQTLNRQYRPFYIPVFMCRIFNLLDLLLSKLGQIHPTIYSAGKFHFDIAGRSDAATRTFSYDARATLADGVRDMQAMMSR